MKDAREGRHPEHDLLGTPAHAATAATLDAGPAEPPGSALWDTLVALAAMAVGFGLASAYLGAHAIARVGGGRRPRIVSGPMPDDAAVVDVAAAPGIGPVAAERFEKVPGPGPA